MPFNGCTAAGCHNFHDNRAIYEDFLEKHVGEAELKIPAVIAVPKPPPSAERRAIKPLSRETADAPPEKNRDEVILTDWHETAHAKAGVNCKGCHAPKNALGEETPWTDKPGVKLCGSCHEAEAKTFVEGKHGMRLKDGMLAAHSRLGGLFTETVLSPMRPELARLPMRPKSRGTELTCTTCDGAHRFDIAKAQVESCVNCHADDHSKAYRGSPHHKLWLAELSGKRAEGTGVTCATCHMPRLEMEDDYGRKRAAITHNQNDTLKPNEKMIRPVCLSCHGMQFTLDSLADKDVIDSNFTLRPSVHVESIDWVVKRAKEKQAK